MGESERSLREVFRKARAASPSIVFFDEIDGLTTSRGSDNGAGDKLITTLLNEMDGIEQLADVLVVAATNRPDVLDPALLRPGRLDRLLYVGPPDYEARLQILQIRAKKMSLADDVQLPLLAQMVRAGTKYDGTSLTLVCTDGGMLRRRSSVDLPGRRSASDERGCSREVYLPQTSRRCRSHNTAPHHRSHVAQIRSLARPSGKVMMMLPPLCRVFLA